MKPLSRHIGILLKTTTSPFTDDANSSQFATQIKKIKDRRNGLAYATTKAEMAYLPENIRKETYQLKNIRMI